MLFLVHGESSSRFSRPSSSSSRPRSKNKIRTDSLEYLALACVGIDACFKCMRNYLCGCMDEWMDEWMDG